MRLFILMLVCLLAKVLSGQSIHYLYPVKVGHKWGYADNRGRIVIEPKYDAVGDLQLPWYDQEDSTSPFRLVETAGKLGLINEQCREVLPPRYRYISPLNHSLFIVADDSRLRLIDSTGRSALEGDFEQVQLLDTLAGWLLKIKRGERWGVYEIGVGEIIPPAYSDITIQHAGKAFFKVKRPQEVDKWGLLDRNHHWILPPAFKNIQAVNQHFFATQEDDLTWVLRDSTGEQILLTRWQDCQLLNPHLVSLKKEDGSFHLFSCVRRDTLSLPGSFTSFRSLNERYIKFRDGFSTGVLDTAGQVVIPATYQDIHACWDSLFQVQQRGSGWGLLSLSRGLLLPMRYDRIGQPANGLAIVQIAGLQGLVDTSFRELIPVAFERLVISDTLIKGYENNELSLFQLTADGQVALLDEFAGVQSIRVGFDQKFYTLAHELKNKPTAIRGVFDENASPFTAQSEGQWLWKRDTDTKKWLLTGQMPGGDPGGASAYLEVLHLKTPKLSLIFSDEKMAPNQPHLLPAIYTVESFPRAALFSHHTGQFITRFDIIGLRGQDFNEGLPLAAFLHQDGRFGLIDKMGKRVTLPSGQPFSCTWIGNFHNGIARFCRGGRLVLAEEGQPVKKEVDVVGNFMVQFGMYTVNHFGNIKDRSLLIENTSDQPLQWGYIDTLGQIVIEPKFDHAGDFTDSFAVNQIGENWGAIDIKGQVRIPFQFQYIAPFHDYLLVGEKSSNRLMFNPNGYERVTKRYHRQGLFSENRCPVQLDSLWGFIDEVGREVIACQYDVVQPFSEGMAAVRTRGFWDFIDPYGQPAFDLGPMDGVIDEVGNFSGGLAWFRVGSSYGYLGQDGQVRIPPDFTKVFDYKFGVARAVYHGKTGLIDTSGQWILQPKRYEYITDFNQWGVAEAREKFKGKRGLLSARGELLAPLKYSSLSPFTEGFATITDGENHGLLNTRGQEVLPLAYSAVGQVAEGLVAIRAPRSHSWHFVDTLGNPAFPGTFEKVEPFQFGHAFVQINSLDPASRFVVNRQGQPLAFPDTDQVEFYEEGVFGIYTLDGEKEGFRNRNYYFADTTGSHLFDRLFEKIAPFEVATALVQLDNRWGMINRNGLFVVPPKYPSLIRQSNGEIVAKSPLLFGLYDKSGRQIFAPAFDHIALMEGHRLRLEFGEKVGYAKKDGKWVWELQK